MTSCSAPVLAAHPAWAGLVNPSNGKAECWTQILGAEAAADALLARPTLAGFGPEEEEDALRRRGLEARLGYGLGGFDDRWTATPTLGFGLSDDDRALRLGW